MKEHSDLGKRQGVAWGRNLRKEMRAGTEAGHGRLINPAMVVELCLVGNREP